MSKNVCVCRSCVDPRENGLYVQHDLPLYNGIYMARKKGAFIPKYESVSDFSTTMSMLIDLGKEPVVIVQGHRDCAAVKLLFNTFGRPEGELNNTEKEFRHSHGDALQIVKQYASVLPEPDQLRLLEKICILQSINNFFEYCAVNFKNSAKSPVMFACFSETPETPPAQGFDPSTIELSAFDTAREAFTQSDVGGNKGRRIVDFIDTKTFLPHAAQAFGIKEPVKIDKVVLNEIRKHVAQNMAQAATPHTLTEAPAATRHAYDRASPGQ